MIEVKFRVWDGKKMWYPNEYDNSLFLMLGDSGYFSVQDHSSEHFKKARIINGFKDLDIINSAEDELILMQYIGLRNWYKGDILQSLHFIENNGKRNYLYHEIKWDNEMFLWKAVSLNNEESESINAHGNPPLWVYIKNSPQAKVIGNIYENPELLQPTKEAGEAEQKK